MLQSVSAATDLDLISYLKAIPDARMRRGVRIPAWYLLLVAVLGILSKCESLRDLERFTRRNHAVLTESLGIELKRPPSDSAFRYFFLQVDVAAICGAIRDWSIAQIPGGASDLDQLICDGKTLRGSIELTSGGGSAFIAQVTLYSAALGVAIAQACYATGDNHERAVLQKLLGELDLEMYSSRRMRSTCSKRFSTAQGAGGRLPPDGQGQPEDSLPADRQLAGKRKIPFIKSDHELSHGRDITWNLSAKEAPEHIKANWQGTSWIAEVIATGTRDGKPFRATHRFITSLRTTPEVLLRLVRECWSIESWHWIRDAQLSEDKHRYRGNGAGAMAALRTAAMNLLRLTGFGSIREGLQAMMHDITALLAMARRQPELKP